jgi:hypothetical protein
MTPRTGSIYLGLLLAAACGDDPIGASDGATETADGSGTATGPTGEDTMQGTGGGGSSESGPPPECEPDPEPTPGGQCSPDCTNGCAGDVCEIECIGDAACETQTLSCAPEMPCVITCDGPDACDEAIIECPPDFACDLTCQGGVDACGTVQYDCGDGSCSLQCIGDPEACLELEMTCGAGECTATCDPGATPPTVTCGSSCACAGC